VSISTRTGCGAGTAGVVLVAAGVDGAGELGVEQLSATGIEKAKNAKGAKDFFAIFAAVAPPIVMILARICAGRTIDMRALISTVAAAAVALGGVAYGAPADRIQDAAKVLREIHAVPDKDIPQDLWNKADCVIVIPSLKKAAFIVGGEYGRGLMSCRQNNAWSAPVVMELEKGSWGFQIGAEAIDLVLLVMNREGMDKLLNNKVTLGAEASVSAGPVGRDARAGTDAQIKAEILSYSRSQGLFAGIDISGGVIKPDKDENAKLYGKNVDPRMVITSATVKTPSEARPFLEALNREAVATSGKK